MVENLGTQEGIIEALDKEIAGNEAGKEAVVSEEGKEVVEEGKEVVEKKEEAPEDPEFDLGLDDKGQALKFKKSQILEFHKGNMLQKDYTQKTQELAAEKANLKEVIEIIEHLKKYPKKAEQVMAILEAKEEEAKEEAFDLNKATKEIDDLLKELPEDDPYAKALRGQRSILQQTLKVNDSLQKRLDQLAQGKESEEMSKIRGEAEQTLQEVISSTQKSLKFADQEESDYWKKQALMYLMHNPKEYSDMDKEQFTAYFKGLAERVHAEIAKMGEKHVNRYIKSKGGGTGIPLAGAGANAEKAKEPVNMGNLQGAIEKELESEMGNNKED
jgi:hypothetical protein